MADRFAELASKRSNLRTKHEEAEKNLKEAESTFEATQKELREVEAELRSELGLETAAPAAAKVKVKGKPGRKKGQKAAAPAGEKNGYPTRGLKKVILDMLERKGQMLPKDITLEVSRLVEKGDYVSESENIAANVAQAIHALKKQKFIKKDEESKTYNLSA